MRNIRLIARLDIKGPHLIKGVHLEGLRKIGNPQEHAYKYYEEGIDEIIYMDTVASLYGRNHLGDLIEDAARDIFVPLTVGGGIRSPEDVENLLNRGADKIAINTSAIADPGLITQIAKKFGSQCVVLSIEAKKVDNSWEAYTDNGRERSGIQVIDWVKKGIDLGAGEVLLTSIDQDGTEKGFDVDLIEKITDFANVPVIASGGLGSKQDFIDVVEMGKADAVAVGKALHYERISIFDLKNNLNKNIKVRPVE